MVDRHVRECAETMKHRDVSTGAMDEEVRTAVDLGKSKGTDSHEEKEEGANGAVGKFVTDDGVLSEEEGQDGTRQEGRSAASLESEECGLAEGMTMVPSTISPVLTKETTLPLQERILMHRHLSAGSWRPTWVRRPRLTCKTSWGSTKF